MLKKKGTRTKGCEKEIVKLNKKRREGKRKEKKMSEKKKVTVELELPTIRFVKEDFTN